MKCSERIHSGGYYQSTCSRNGKVERDGKWYCGQHDPVAVEERRAARSRRWDEEDARREAVRKEARIRRERADLCVTALEGIADPLEFVTAAKALHLALGDVSSPFTVMADLDGLNTAQVKIGKAWRGE